MDTDGKADPARLRWQDADEETGNRASSRTANLTRKNSTASIASQFSIRSMNRRTTVDPSLTLPIHYRTISFEIDEGKERKRAEAAEAKDAIADDLSNLEWHILSAIELQKQWQVDASQGLSTEQAKQHISQYGKNAISHMPHPWVSQILGYFFKGFGAILLIGCILVFISWKPLGQPPAVANLALAIVLLAVFFIQAAFNAWQDWSSSRVMASITAMLPESCLVLRDGSQSMVPASEVVPGDIVYLKAGNKLPADIRFLEVSNDACLDRSILTVFGRIAKLTNEPKTGLSTLEKEILRFVILIVLIMLMMVIIVIIVWATWLRKDHPGWINVPTLIVDCVSIAIAFIPEGLPIALTASLTITAALMSKNKILCKSLKTVETLGAVSVICSDKTGTLTRNQMFATDSAVGSSSFDPAAIKEDMLGVQHLRSIAALCNAAEFDASSANIDLSSRRIYGDATDQAVLRFSESLGPTDELRRKWKKTHELPFNSKNKFMVRTLTPTDPEVIPLALSAAEASEFKQEDRLLTIKGAPDILIERCSKTTGVDGSLSALDSSTLATVKELKDRWSSEGKRVILLARKVLRGSEVGIISSSQQFDSEVLRQAGSDLILVGLLGIVDPPRGEIPDVVNTLRIVTAARVDDINALQRFPNPRSIEKEGTVSSAIVITGADLTSLNDHQWDQLCRYQEIVFSRTTPEQKLRIVREFRARDEIVGMTGDGVNDAPSLKAADIGIALGSGSDIAIEASDMVLLDSLSAIVEAVQYGRVVFDNLKKTIVYLLPAGSFSEFWPVMASVVFGLPQVLSSFLMIIICCFTDCAAATVLAYEKPEADVLLRPPRKPKRDRLVNWKLILHAYGIYGMLETVASFSMAFWYLERNRIPFSALWFKFGALPEGIDQDYYNAKMNEASSVYFINLVVMQWFNLMAVRTRRLSIFQHPPALDKQTQNLLLFPAILFALVMAVFWLYIPSLQEVLNTTNVPAEHYFLPAAFGLGILCLDEMRKAGVRRWPNGILAKCAW
ncbi:cation-translocating P-type ATPase [Aspergillus tanneri]|uniref:Cation-transporting P-type ATPase N-terminal domain-containing protein n=1 Tax=Aspergillus tanneri TaxID=1220188 RepID=A0A5M9MUP1_9EURO|nr:uncharacterized protein ATNIH1004_003520 [Aspergillus tanneri]KAA8650831.1 hypothetical protein ATNIH1004_003520 [Aspergillus tanneri]